MKDKEYGVKLTADIDKFKKKMLEAKDISNSVSDAIKDKIKNPMEMAGESGKRSFDDRIAKIAELSGKYGELVMQYLNVVSLEGRNSESANKLKQEIKELAKQVEIEGDELGEVAEAMEDLGDETDDTEKKGHNFIGIFQNFDGSLKKAVSSIKRFSLSLLGIQSLYSALTKATNAYMNTDETLHNKLQASWIALGAIMAPIIEKLIELFQKLVGYINIFVKVFTGGKVDLIGRALKKVEEKTKKNTKAQKELNKELANFDEITNLNFDAGSSDIGTDIPSIEDYLKEMQDMKLNPQIVEIITNLANKLRDLWDWIVKNKEEILLFGGVFATVLVGLKIGDTIKKLSEMFKLVETASGATGAFGLWGLAIAGIVADIALALALINEINEAVKVDKEAQEQELKLADSRLKTMSTIREELDKVNEKLAQGLTQDENGIDLQARKKELIRESNREYDAFNSDLKDGKRYTKEQVEEMNKLKRKIEDITNAPHRAEIEFNAKWKKGALYDFGMEFANGLQSLTKFDFKGAFLDYHFAKGNVAYEPTVAEFGEYAGASSNPEITTPQNIMRETLFEALEQALPLVNTGSSQEHGDIVLNVNGKEFARATYGDYQSEARRMGSSNVAIRRS